MKIVFINRFFFPDHSATSQLLTDVAFHLAQTAGGCSRNKPTNLRQPTGSSTQPGPASTASGSYASGPPGSDGDIIGRTLDYITFYAGALWNLLSLTARGDVIVAKTDPPLISVLAALVARVRGALLVNWIQDLFPGKSSRTWSAGRWEDSPGAYDPFEIGHSSLPNGT